MWILKPCWDPQKQIRSKKIWILNHFWDPQKQLGTKNVDPKPLHKNSLGSKDVDPNPLLGSTKTI